jgi:hypothetical protein
VERDAILHTGAAEEEDKEEEDDDDEDGFVEANEQSKTRGRGKKARKAEYTKSYNMRSVVRILFPDLVDKRFKQLVSEGVPKMQAYQPALTHVIGQLSEEDLEKCAEKVQALKKNDWPRDLQIV